MDALASRSDEVGVPGYTDADLVDAARAVLAEEFTSTVHAWQAPDPARCAPHVLAAMVAEHRRNPVARARMVGTMPIHLALRLVYVATREHPAALVALADALGVTSGATDARLLHLIRLTAGRLTLAAAARFAAAVFLNRTDLAQLDRWLSLLGPERLDLLARSGMTSREIDDCARGGPVPPRAHLEALAAFRAVA